MNNNRGIIDATDRVLRESLAKTSVKENIRILINNIDPESTPNLARTLMWQDVEVILSLMSAMPLLANSIIGLIDEILLQVDGKFSSEMLSGFVYSMLEEIDTEKLARARQNIKPIIDILAPLIEEKWQSTSDKEVEHVSAN